MHSNWFVAEIMVDIKTSFFHAYIDCIVRLQMNFRKFEMT